MANESHSTYNQLTLIVIWVLIGVLSRILPHPVNVTALTSLSLLTGLQFSRTASLLIIGIILLLSDLMLSYLYGYVLFGSWSLFTYSAYAGIVLLSYNRINSDHKIYLFSFLISMSLF